jgi:Family of unknown function (DUF6130)
MSAQSARDVRGASPLITIENEPPARLIVDPPIPEALAAGRVFIQYRAESRDLHQTSHPDGRSPLLSLAGSHPTNIMAFRLSALSQPVELSDASSHHVVCIVRRSGSPSQWGIRSLKAILTNSATEPASILRIT